MGTTRVSSNYHGPERKRMNLALTWKKLRTFLGITSTAQVFLTLPRFRRIIVTSKHSCACNHIPLNSPITAFNPHTFVHVAHLTNVYHSVCCCVGVRLCGDFRCFPITLPLTAFLQFCNSAILHVLKERQQHGVLLPGECRASCGSSQSRF
jgi:hypothetical protein